MWCTWNMHPGPAAKAPECPEAHCALEEACVRRTSHKRTLGWRGIVQVVGIDGRIARTLFLDTPGHSHSTLLDTLILTSSSSEPKRWAGASHVAHIAGLPPKTGINVPGIGRRLVCWLRSQASARPISPGNQHDLFKPHDGLDAPSSGRPTPPPASSLMANHSSAGLPPSRQDVQL